MYYILKRIEGKAINSYYVFLTAIDPNAEKRRKAVAAMVLTNTTFGVVVAELLEKLEKNGIAKATKVRNDRSLKQLEAEASLQKSFVVQTDLAELPRQDAVLLGALGFDAGRTHR